MILQFLILQHLRLWSTLICGNWLANTKIRLFSNTSWLPAFTKIASLISAATWLSSAASPTSFLVKMATRGSRLMSTRLITLVWRYLLPWARTEKKLSIIQPESRTWRTLLFRRNILSLRRGKKKSQSPWNNWETTWSPVASVLAKKNSRSASQTRSTKSCA